MCRIYADSDNNGVPDRCEDRCAPDSDGDGCTDDVDLDVDSPSGNLDNDALGDDCDPDMDGDGVDNDVDLCPRVADDQTDTDGDLLGDACDADDDDDGVLDGDDDFPLDNTEWTDTDDDGIGDNTDPNIDGDRLSNDEDADPYDPLSDTDGDGSNDSDDLFPLDPLEWANNDGDSLGDNADRDDDNDAVDDYRGAFNLASCWVPGLPIVEDVSDPGNPTHPIRCESTAFGGSDPFGADVTHVRIIRLGDGDSGDYEEVGQFPTVSTDYPGIVMDIEGALAATRGSYVAFVGDGVDFRNFQETQEHCVPSGCYVNGAGDRICPDVECSTLALDSTPLAAVLAGLGSTMYGAPDNSHTWGFVLFNDLAGATTAVAEFLQPVDSSTSTLRPFPGFGFALDTARTDENTCLDSDDDACDDCSSGTFAPSNDGTDTDSDGVCDGQ